MVEGRRVDRRYARPCGRISGAILRHRDQFFHCQVSIRTQFLKLTVIFSSAQKKRIFDGEASRRP